MENHESEGLYRYIQNSQVNLYRCLEPYRDELTDYKLLYVYTYNVDHKWESLFVDTYGQEYRAVEKTNPQVALETSGYLVNEGSQIPPPNTRVLQEFQRGDHQRASLLEQEQKRK